MYDPTPSVNGRRSGVYQAGQSLRDYRSLPLLPIARILAWIDGQLEYVYFLAHEAMIGLPRWTSNALIKTTVFQPIQRR